MNGLLEFTFVQRAVAHETQGYPIFAVILAGQGQPGGDGQLPADDGVATHEVLGGVEKVHGAAFPLADTGGLAKKFRHDAAGIQSPGQGMAVVPVVGDHVVLVRQGCDRADGDGFFTSVDV